MRVGIIGFGAFGQFIAGQFPKGIKLEVFSRKDRKSEFPEIKFVSLEEITECEVIILAINIENYQQVLTNVAPNLSRKNIIVDVCSVKSKPLKILKETLNGRCQFVATHPLFGPQTKGDGKNIVVSGYELDDKEKVFNYIKNQLGLNIIEMSADEHDKQMAWVHGLSFFLGRGLKELELPKTPIETEYYKKLLEIVELEKAHTLELFNTVQKGNPYAQEIREKFIEVLNKMNRELEESN